MSSPNLVCPHVDELPNAITAPIQPLWRNGYFVCSEPTHNFYYDPDLDVIAMDWQD